MTDQQLELMQIPVRAERMSHVQGRGGSEPEDIRLHLVASRQNGLVLLHFFPAVTPQSTSINITLHNKFYVKPTKKYLAIFGRRHEQAIFIGNVTSLLSPADTRVCLSRNQPLPVQIIGAQTYDRDLTRAFQNTKVAARWPVTTYNNTRSIWSGLVDGGVVSTAIIGWK